MLNYPVVQESGATSSPSNSAKPDASSANESAGGAQQEQQTEQKATDANDSAVHKAQRIVTDAAQETVKLSSEVAAEMARRLGIAGIDSHTKSTGVLVQFVWTRSSLHRHAEWLLDDRNTSSWCVQIQVVEPQVGLNQPEKWEPALPGKVAKRLAKIAVALVQVVVAQMSQAQLTQAPSDP